MLMLDDRPEISIGLKIAGYLAASKKLNPLTGLFPLLMNLALTLTMATNRGPQRHVRALLIHLTKLTSDRARTHELTATGLSARQGLT